MVSQLGPKAMRPSGLTAISQYLLCSNLEAISRWPPRVRVGALPNVQTQHPICSCPADPEVSLDSQSFAVASVISITAILLILKLGAYSWSRHSRREDRRSYSEPCVSGRAPFTLLVGICQRRHRTRLRVQDAALFPAGGGGVTRRVCVPWFLQCTFHKSRTINT